MVVAICDDEVIFRENTKRICIDYMQTRRIEMELIEFTSGEELLAYNGKIDILFLDILMQGIDGITVKENLELERRQTIIIYLTSHTKYMQRAFGRQVYSFLTKPLQVDQFCKIMDRIVDEYVKDLIIPIDSKDTPYIRASSIIYIEADDKYTIVNTASKEYLVRRSMNEWESMLGRYGFYRIHKSFYINMAYVKKIKSSSLCVNESELSISRKYLKNFRETYYSYIRDRVISKE